MKIVKTNDCITVTELLKVNKWNPYLTTSYLGVPEFSHALGEKVFMRSHVKKIESKLTKLGIEWRVKE
jgi:hypothetical protein